MKCPKCKKEIPNDSVFCNYCGESLDIPSGFKVCPHCGRYIPDDSEFCQYCGTTLDLRPEDRQKNGSIKQKVTSNKKTFLGKRQIVLIAIGIIVIVAVVLLIVLPGKNTGNAVINNEYSTSESAGYLVTLRSTGNGNTFDITAYYDSPMPKVDAPSRDGYIFKGYYSSTNGNGTQYYDANMQSTKNWDKKQGGTLYAYWVEKNGNASNANEQSTSKAATEESTSNQLKPVHIANGTILVKPKAERVAPLEIISQEGDNYYIYLECRGISEDDMAFYVEGGKTLTVDVPIRDYYIYYATGQVWYGRNHLFGDNTKYYKCDDIFDFHWEGNSAVGYSLTLYKVVNGNLDTEEISSSSFPEGN